MRHTTTGNAKPWEVAKGYVHESPQHARWEELPSTANVITRLIGGGMLVFICLALIVGTVSVLTPSQPLCSEECR